MLRSPASSKASTREAHLGLLEFAVLDPGGSQVPESVRALNLDVIEAGGDPKDPAGDQAGPGHVAAGDRLAPLSEGRDVDIDHAVVAELEGEGEFLAIAGDRDRGRSVVLAAEVHLHQAICDRTQGLSAIASAGVDPVEADIAKTDLPGRGEGVEREIEVGFAEVSGDPHDLDRRRIRSLGGGLGNASPAEENERTEGEEQEEMRGHRELPLSVAILATAGALLCPGSAASEGACVPPLFV